MEDVETQFGTVKFNGWSKGGYAKWKRPPLKKIKCRSCKRVGTYRNYRDRGYAILPLVKCSLCGEVATDARYAFIHHPKGLGTLTGI